MGLWARLIGLNIGVLGALLIVFELLSWFFLPASLQHRLWPYRCTECQPPLSLSPGHGLPAGYLRADPARGFDIKASQPPTDHFVDGFYYKVWSNSLGCFDREPPQDLGRYVYLAGDSSAWGYAAFEQKFGTLLESAIGTPILKCGVVNTGTRHQFSKMQGIVAAIGKIPAVIVVAFDPNDIDNDYVFPHSTVIDGWLIDNKHVKALPDGNYEITQRSEVELRKALSEYLARIEGGIGWTEALWYEARKYSATLNIARGVWNRLGIRFGPSIQEQLPGIYRRLGGKGDRLEYTNNPEAASNKESVLAFRRFVEAQGAKLLFVLMPPKEQHGNVEYYGDMRAFLDSNGLAYIDPSTEFAQHAVHEVYWPKDVHINPTGNALIANLLERKIERLLASRP